MRRRVSAVWLWLWLCLALSDYSKREGHLSFEQEAELRVHLTAHPMWISPEVRTYIEQTYGQRYSKLGAIKLMTRLGFAYKKSKLLRIQTSPEAQRCILNIKAARLWLVS